MKSSRHILLFSQPPLRAFRRYAKRRIALPLLCSLVSACATEHYDSRPISAKNVAQNLNDHSLNSPALRDFVRSHAPQRDEIWPPQRWDFRSLTLVAFFFNPDLEAARARLATAQAGQVTAAQRPNPVLQLPLQWTTNPKAGDSPWIAGFALDIPIETAGKRAYRENEASHLATASQFQVANVAWDVRSQLREQLLSLWSTYEKVMILQHQVELDQRLVVMLEKRLSAGYAAVWEVNQQRALLLQSRNDLLNAQRDMATVKIRVAAVLGLRVEALADISLDLEKFGQPAPDVPAQDVRVEALLNRTDILESLEQYAATQAALQLEVAKQYPNLHLGPGYTFDQGAHKLGFDFTGLELPVFHRNEGPIAEARGRRLEAEARVKQLEAKAFSEVDSAIAAYNATRNMVSQNESQLAVQRRQLRSAQHALELGQDDRMSLTLAEKTELLARLAALDSAVQMQQAVGKIEDAMQRPISEETVPYTVSEPAK